MERPQLSTASVPSWFDQIVAADWAAQATNSITNLPPAIVAALLLLPVAIALVSRRVLAILAVVLLVALAWLAIFRPAVLGTFVVLDVYLVSLIVAITAISSARRQRRLNEEMATLRAEMTRLRDAEQQRFIADLKASTRETRAPEPRRDQQEG